MLKSQIILYVRKMGKIMNLLSLIDPDTVLIIGLNLVHDRWLVLTSVECSYISESL